MRAGAWFGTSLSINSGRNRKGPPGGRLSAGLDGSREPTPPKLLPGAARRETAALAARLVPREPGGRGGC